MNIVVVGVGLIGERHARLLTNISETNLSAIVDPSPSATELACELQVPCFNSIQDMLSADQSCDGVIIATPNETHLEFALTCIENEIPCLIEKPLASDSKDARAIAAAGEKAKIPVLVGHHRRHHHVCKNLKTKIESDDFGLPVAAQLTWMLRKPNEYFAKGAWRTEKGGGPIWINMIHEIDLLRYFLGEISEVQAMVSNVIRGNPVEDTAAISLRFSNGALATAIVADCAPSPWHFEGATGENPNISKTGGGGLRVFGTRQSIEFPSLTIWQHNDEDGHWGTPISSSGTQTSEDLGSESALTAQILNFAGVIAGKEKPLVSANDGLQSVRVVEAIHRAANLGETVQL